MLTIIFLWYYLHGDRMKEKIFNFLKRNRWIFFSMALSSVVISVIYTLQKIAPFGNSSMLDVDFYHQYGPLLNELYDRVKSGESLLYSFNTGGGIPFYRNFLNYLSSPFNLLLFLFKKENIVMAFSIIIGLKAVFASLTMSYYLKKTFKKDGILVALFGILYAFSGYFCAYYWNIMWLDGMVFLPLILLGINKIIEEEKPNLYVISLAIMLFANYFIGYMICLFSVVYFIGIFIYKGNFKIKNIIKKGFMFALSSILSAGLIAFLLLPLFYSMTSISATGDAFPDLSTSFSISDYVFNHFTGVTRTVFASDVLPLPNVYPGMLVLALIVVLFMNKKINVRFKIISAFSLLFFFLMFNITTFDFVWHAFHIPNDLPWRYSFIYTFVLATIGYYSMSKINEVSVVKLSVSFAIITILLLISSKLGFENITDKKVIICITILLLYYILCLLTRSKRVNKRILYSVFSLVVVFECVYGIDSNWQIDHDIKTFMSDKKTYESLIETAMVDDNGLYRIEKTDYLTLNDGAWYDYKGISTFTSMAYENTAKTQRMLGLAGNNINSYYYRYYQTPVYNSMYNVKYIMGDYVENDMYELISSEDGYNLTRYKYDTSIAYAVNDEIENWNLVSYKPFLNQQNFVTSSTGINDVFEEVKVSEKTNVKSITNTSDNLIGELNYKVEGITNEITLTLDNESKENIYLYVGGSGVSSIEVDGVYYSLTSDEYYVFDIGKKYTEEVEVKINLDDQKEGLLYFYAYRLNQERFKEFYDAIKSNALNVSKYNDTYIEGEITADDDKTLFTTISYDEGWSIYVDGKKVETKLIANAYLGCDIEKGTHEVKLIYYPKGMKEGLIVSGISFGIIILYNIFNEKKNSKKNKKGEFIV